MQGAELERIAQAALLAPSADNRHVVRLEYLDQGLRLWPSPEFAACDVPHRRVLGWFAVGAMVQNMRVAAAAQGLHADVELDAQEPQGAAPLGDLRLAALEDEDTAVAALAPALADRTTNRRMYRRTPVAEPDLESMRRQARHADATADIHWPQGEDRRLLLSLVWQAESERFLRRDLHAELYQSIRFDLGWHDSADDHLPPGALEVEPPMRPGFRLLGHWPLMRAFSVVGGHRLLGLRAAWLPCWQAPRLGLVSVRQGEPLVRAAVAAGKAFEAAWLQATLSGLALQPMAAAPLYAWADATGEGVRPQVQRTLVAGWERLLPGRVPLMVFRLGHAAPPSVRTRRPPLQQLLVTGPA